MGLIVTELNTCLTLSKMRSLVKVNRLADGAEAGLGSQNVAWRKTMPNTGYKQHFKNSTKARINDLTKFCFHCG